MKFLNNLLKTAMLFSLFLIASFAVIAVPEGAGVTAGTPETNSPAAPEQILLREDT